MRSYLAVAGGIDVPKLMGSRSTYVKGGFGGLGGRPLRAGDELETLGAPPEDDFDEVALPESFVQPTYGHDHRVRVVLGPQSGAFTEQGVETLLGAEYKVSVQSDRMGYRLDGPAIEHVSGPDIVVGRDFARSGAGARQRSPDHPPRRQGHHRGVRKDRDGRKRGHRPPGPGGFRAIRCGSRR